MTTRLGLHPTTVLTAASSRPQKGAQEPLQTKGEGMKRNLFRGLLVSLFAVGLGAAAHAQEPDRLIVDIPYDFVLNGTSLPAGKYKVERYDFNDVRMLVLIDAESNKPRLTFAGELSGAHPTRPSVTLHQVGDQRFLTQIQTAEHVFELPQTKAAFKAAAAKAEQAGYLAGTAESNKQ
jgi:hypothetical protein